MTSENMVSLHCHSTQANNEKKKEKAVMDGIWVTLVTKANKEDLKKYFENSQICMKKVLPNVIKKKALESEKSEANKIRSVRVLYEGGLMSKKKYPATVLYKSNASEMRQFRSLSLRIFIEKLREISREKSMRFER